MFAIITLLVILAVSMLITRIASVALVHTGMSTEMAKFQARSAFTGVGFTTSEAESVVRHPVRRRIVLVLMLLGNVGIVSALGSLVLSFVGAQGTAWPFRLLLLCAGLALLWAIARNRFLDRWMHRAISRALARYTDVDVRDYARLLRLRDEYTVTELRVAGEDWLADRTLAELSLRDEGVVVLGIARGEGGYVGAPGGDTRILADDTLLLYGREEVLRNLDTRRQDRGEREHERAVVDHKRLIADEMREDAAHFEGREAHEARSAAAIAAADAERAARALQDSGEEPPQRS